MPKIFSEVRRLPEFDKDFNRLQKKFRTLEEDLQVFIERQLKLLHKLGQDNRGCVRISDLDMPYPHIYKARKFACKSLKGKGVASGIRVIYAHYPQEDVIEFIEIYYKGNKENENRDRILNKYRT